MLPARTATSAPIHLFSISSIVLRPTLHYTSRMKKLFPIFLLLICTPVMAVTCKYATLDGQVMYANVPIKNARKVECFGQEESAASGKKSRERNTSINPTPADFPRVDASTQQQRDGTRRRILTDELAAERNALELARKTGKTTDIALHERNVQMLEKELSSIR